MLHANQLALAQVVTMTPAAHSATAQQALLLQANGCRVGQLQLQPGILVECCA